MTALTISGSELEVQLQKRIDLGEKILARNIQTREDLDQAKDDLQSWTEFNSTLLRKSFTTTEMDDEYCERGMVSVSVLGSRRLSEAVSDFHIDAKGALRRLRSIFDRVQLFDSQLSRLDAPLATAPENGRVFIVHGRDSGVKEAVARAVNKLTDGRALILHEEPNQGQTIIEKLEKSAKMATFAVVLLTGDDEGKLRGTGAEEYKPRGRQNVILELGFFIGMLGRSRVAVLHEQGVELPSDILGVVYTLLDGPGLWRYQLGKELQAAGFSVDLNVL